MKVLKSHRDDHFLSWSKEDFMRYDGALSPIARFEYVSIERMQRGDGIQESEAYFEVLESLRESIPRDGMISPIIIVSTKHSYWAEWVPTSKNFWQIIPYVIQTGNNRYRIAVENGYTHISTIAFGPRADPRAWNYLREELKKPLSQRINVGKKFGESMLGNILFEGESLTVV